MPITTPLTSLLGITHPILSAPMDGIATHESVQGLRQRRLKLQPALDEEGLKPSRRVLGQMQLADLAPFVGEGGLDRVNPNRCAEIRR